MKLHSFNEAFFDEIDTQEKAYFLGFIVADGCVFVDPTRRDYFLRIKINSRDAGLLWRFKELLNATQSVVTRGNLSLIDLYSRHMVDTLIRYGILPKKSRNGLGSIHIPVELERHFYRGLFDGDGSLHITGGIPRLTLYGNEGILLDFINFLERNSITVPHAVYRDNRVNSPYYRSLVIRRRNDVIDTLNLLYSWAYIYLDRKYEKYLQVIQNYHKL